MWFVQKKLEKVLPVSEIAVSLHRNSEMRCLVRSFKTTNWALSSAGSERLPYKQRVGGSNPSAPTKKAKSKGFAFFSNRTYNSPSSRLISCSSVRMDCSRSIICDVSLAALWFLFRMAFAAAIFMPRTLSKL